MSVDLDSRDTAARKAPLSLTADLLKNACAADALFRERYDLSTWQELGRGAFAGVARIYCRDRAEEVAVKVFYCLTEESRARMRAEVANAQRAYSELLVRVHTPFSSGDLAWIEMELVRGRNLDQEITRRRAEGDPFDVDEGLGLGIAIGEALNAAHRSGVIHRDLKPANLLLPEGGKPKIKLGDFGISKFLEAEKLTATGEIPGTPQYAAPEVWESRGVGTAADVYSLGLVLFRILTTGEYAYDLRPGATTAQVFVAHRTGIPRRLRDLKPTAPPQLDDLIQRMLAKDSKARPTVEKVLSALGSLRAQRAEAPETALPRRSVALVAMAGSGALVALALLAGVALRPTEIEIPMASIAPRPTTMAIAARPAQPAPSPPAQARVSEAQPRPKPGQPGTPPAARAPSAPLAFQVAIEGPGVAVTNVSGRLLSGLRVTLVTVRGSRHTVRLSEELVAGDVALIPLEELEPVPEAEAAFVRAEVSAEGSNAKTATVALRPGDSR